MEPIASYKTDFNDVEDDGMLTALAGWGGSLTIPNVGDLVELFDGDANTCYGFVDHIDMSNAMIFVVPVWDSWQDAPESTMPDLADALFEAMRAVDDGQRTASDLKTTA
jgi:hypothetical protein